MMRWVIAFRAAIRVSSDTSCWRALKRDDVESALAPLAHEPPAAAKCPPPDTDALLLLVVVLLADWTPGAAASSSMIPLAVARADEGPAICLIDE